MNEELQYYIELDNKKAVIQIWIKKKKDSFFIWSPILENNNEERFLDEDNAYEITKESFDKIMLNYISIDSLFNN